MADFLTISSSFPTVVFTVLLGIIFLYWVLAILGAVDIDMLDLDVDVDGDVASVGGLTGLLSTLGLSGPPFTVVLSILIVISWLFSYFSSAYVLPLLPWDMLRDFIGAGLLVGSFVLAIPITSQLIKPLKGLFVVHSAKSKSQFVGATCKITTLEVTDSFGQGEIDDGEARIIISVRATTPNTFTKGNKAVVVSYDPEKGTYEIVPENEFHD